MKKLGEIKEIKTLADMRDAQALEANYLVQIASSFLPPDCEFNSSRLIKSDNARLALSTMISGRKITGQKDLCEVCILHFRCQSH